MTRTVFYSWQSSSDPQANRDLIRLALQEAIQELPLSLELVEGTSGLPGAPPIFDAIATKITSCSLFVADISLVIGIDQERRSCNPNVLIEFGFALAKKSYSAVILVMNEQFGSPRQLPFDLSHLQVLTYNLGSDADSRAISSEHRKLCNQIKLKINASLFDPKSILSLSDKEAKIAMHLARSAKRGFADDFIYEKQISEALSLSIEDCAEVLSELSSRGYLKEHATAGGSFYERSPQLYFDLDAFVHGWEPSVDALEIARTLRDENKISPGAFSEARGWPIRRMNAAMHFILNKEAANGSATGSQFVASFLLPTNSTRAFIRAGERS